MYLGICSPCPGDWKSTPFMIFLYNWWSDEVKKWFLISWLSHFFILSILFSKFCFFLNCSKCCKWTLTLTLQSWFFNQLVFELNLLLTNKLEDMLLFSVFFRSPHQTSCHLFSEGGWKPQVTWPGRKNPGDFWDCSSVRHTLTSLILFLLTGCY